MWAKSIWEKLYGQNILWKNPRWKVHMWGQNPYGKKLIWTKSYYVKFNVEKCTCGQSLYGKTCTFSSIKASVFGMDFFLRSTWSTNKTNYRCVAKLLRIALAILRTQFKNLNIVSNDLLGPSLMSAACPMAVENSSSILYIPANQCFDQTFSIAFSIDRRTIAGHWMF